MMNDTVKTTEKPGVIENVTIGGQSSRLSSVIFFLLCIVPVFTTVLYGGVDNMTWIVVTICWVAIILMWLIEAWRAKGLVFESSNLQLPLIGLLLIGLIQLLPLGSGVGDAIISVPATNSLTLDPNGTRFFLSHLIIYIVFFGGPYTQLLVKVDENPDAINEEHYKMGTFGLEGGLGVRLYLLTLDIKYGYGLTKLYSQDRPDRMSGVGLYAGLFF